MNLAELPPEILTLISEYTGVYNFNLAQVSLLFREIAKRNYVAPEEFRDGLFQEGDLAMIEYYNLPFTERNIEKAVPFGHLHVLIWAYEKGFKLSKNDHPEIVNWLRENNHC